MTRRLVGCARERRASADATQLSSEADPALCLHLACATALLRAEAHATAITDVADELAVLNTLDERCEACAASSGPGNAAAAFSLQGASVVEVRSRGCSCGPRTGARSSEVFSPLTQLRNKYVCTAIVTNPHRRFADPQRPRHRATSPQSHRVYIESAAFTKAWLRVDGSHGVEDQRVPCRRSRQAGTRPSGTVNAQFGADSNELQALGLVKKSEKAKPAAPKPAPTPVKS